MHKLTIFTIIFSAVVVITVGELVVHDYLDRHADDAKVSVGESKDEEAVSEPEEIEEEEPAPEFDPSPSLPNLDFASYGFAGNAELREKSFPSAGVFSLLEYESSASEGFYWELFEGEEYAGGLYEIVCENPTEAFTVYTDLRESASDSDSGEVNEVNMYGEASFYFNHTSKTTTIFKVILNEDRVYAFTYAHKYHNEFKELFEVDLSG